MLCYQCQEAPPAGGLRLGARQAVGICHDCGVAVCTEHGHKQPGQPFLCGECSEVRRTTGAGIPERAA
jgi:hypothetical protein